MNIMFMTLLMDMDNILSVEEPEKVCQLFLFNLFSPSVTGIFFIFHTKKLLQNYLSWNKETEVEKYIIHFLHGVTLCK